jgi:hypothetical protein
MYEIRGSEIASFPINKIQSSIRLKMEVRNVLRTVVVVCCGIVGLLESSVQAYPRMLLSTMDASVSSWGEHSGQSVTLAILDGAYWGERVANTFIKFDMPILGPGESFVSATLLMHGQNAWNNVGTAYRVYTVGNSWGNNITWETQPQEGSISVIGFKAFALVDTQHYSGSQVAGQWLSWNVLSAMQSGATVSLAVDINRDGGGGGGGGWFDSLEQGWGPTIEYTIVTEECLPLPHADFNGDCKVDFEDFAIMASEWLYCNWSNQNLCQ